MLILRKLHVLLIVLIIIPLLHSCALFMKYDGAELSEADSSKVKVQSNLHVVAYKKHGNTADEDRLGVLNWKSKIPAGKYRFEVSINEEGFGRSFIPVSIELEAKAGAAYWIAYQKEYGFSNKWSPFISTSEPDGFYGILEFWKKD